MINHKKIKILFISVLLMVSTIAFSEVPDANQVEIKTFHTYHNFLGGFVLTNNKVGSDFMEKYFSSYVYDGLREWDVVFTGLGFYSKYVYEDTILYTNSMWVKAALNWSGIPRSSGWVCIELDVENIDE